MNRMMTEMNILIGHPNYDRERPRQNRVRRSHNAAISSARLASLRHLPSVHHTPSTATMPLNRMPTDVMREILQEVNEPTAATTIRLVCRDLADNVGEILFEHARVDRRSWMDGAEGLRGIARHLKLLVIDLGKCEFINRHGYLNIPSVSRITRSSPRRRPCHQ